MRWTKAVWIMNLALVVLLGYMLAGVILRSPVKRESVPVHSVQRASVEHNSSSVTDEECSVIVKRNIFASGEATDDALGRDYEPSTVLAKTQLQLRLLGTVAGDEIIARAIIEDLPSKAQDLYKTGDIVQGARIARIERNRVILVRGERREVLELYLTSGGPVEAGATENASLPDVREAVSVISPSAFRIDKRAFLARIGGVEAILKVAKLTPYVVDGETEGLCITGIENVGMARFVGIENGDVVQAVNGQKLTSQQKAFQVFRKARAQSSLDVQLLRGGDEKTLSFSVK